MTLGKQVNSIGLRPKCQATSKIMRHAAFLNWIIFIGLFMVYVAQALRREEGRPGKQCPDDVPKLGFGHARHQKKTPKQDTRERCRSLLDGSPNDRRRFRIHCSPFKGADVHAQCSDWCQVFASCFNVTRTKRWVNRCTRKFRSLSQRFVIVEEENKVSPSVAKLRIRPCRQSWKGLFLIEINTCSCSGGDENGGNVTACQQRNKRSVTEKRSNITSLLQNCLGRRRRDRLASDRWLPKEGPIKRMCQRGVRFDTIQIKPSRFTIYASGLGGRRNLVRISGKRDKNMVTNTTLPIFGVQEYSCDYIDTKEDVTLPHSEKLMRNFCTSLIDEIDDEEKNAIQNASSLLENTIQDFKNASSIESQQANAADKDLQQNAYFTTIAFEDFVVRQLNNTKPLYDVREKVDLKAGRVFHQSKEEFILNDTKGNNSIKIPAENFENNDSVVLGVIYKDLHELFMTESTKTKKTRVINTIIMSATIYPRSAVLQKNITLVFNTLKPAGKKRECVFWNYSENNTEGWSGEGCYARKITSSETECVCNHLTHFAVLMDFTDDDSTAALMPDEINILKILTYVGLALSLLGSVITIICYLLLTDKNALLSQIRVSLLASLLAGQITFLAGIDATENKVACVTVAALMQYFFMAALCWMLVEGICLYLFVVKVYNFNHKMSVYHGMSWGIPAIFVAISLGISADQDGLERFVSKKHCWLSSDNNLIWTFVSFVVVIELVNAVILVLVIKAMASMQHAKDKHTEQIRLGIKACLFLTPLLGGTWLFGLLLPLHKAFIYIFVLLNSTQGFFIFILHCVRNGEIRARFKRRIQPVGSGGVKSKDRTKTTSRSQNPNSGNEVNVSEIYELRD